jgi:hypothetical protein
MTPKNNRGRPGKHGPNKTASLTKRTPAEWVALVRRLPATSMRCIVGSVIWWDYYAAKDARITDDNPLREFVDQWTSAMEAKAVDVYRALRSVGYSVICAKRRCQAPTSLTVH